MNDHIYCITVGYNPRDVFFDQADSGAVKSRFLAKKDTLDGSYRIIGYYFWFVGRWKIEEGILKSINEDDIISVEEFNTLDDFKGAYIEDFL